MCDPNVSKMISPNRLDVAIRLTLICVKFYQNEHKMSTFLTSLILIIRLSFLFGVESTVLQIECIEDFKMFILAANLSIIKLQVLKLM